MKSLKEDPRESKYKGVLVGIPTFGMVSINFLVSQATSGMPIFTSRSYMPVIGKPVDIARNEIAAQALATNHGFVWFRDDDVSAEPDAAIKLMARMSAKQRANPFEVGEMIVGGVVYSKIKPPSPMIYRDDVVGGFEDWSYGDLVECDAMGMGCTLIPTGVFKNILKDGLNEFQCVNDSCPVNWEAVHEKDVEKCPTCGGPLAPIFFKTVRAGVGLGGKPIEVTEDTYFCLLAKDSGASIYADCSVQCQHECVDTGTMYYFHRGAGVPVWECDGVIDFWPQVPTKGDPKKEILTKVKNSKKNGKVKFNLGSGGINKKGFVNIDLYEDSDFKCDARDLRPAISKYGFADEIEADHLIEHVNRTAITATVRNWIKALKPGGKLTFTAPDAIAAMNDFIEADKNGTKREEYDFKEAVVFGGQRYTGDEHQTAITERKMKKVIASCRSQIEDYKVESGRFKGKNQDEIIVTLTKKKAAKPLKKEKK